MARNIHTILTLQDQFSSPLRRIVSNTRDVQNQLRRTSNQVTGFRNSAVNGFSSVLRSAKTLAAGLGVSFGAFKIGSDVINTYAEFEQSMKNISAVTGLTGDALKEMETLARDMGAKTSKTAKESADALYYMALAGWDAEQMGKGLEPVLRLSEAGAIDLARASDLVINSMATTGVTVDELGGYLDLVAQAAAASTTDVDTLMESFIGVGGTLKNLNVPLEESATLLGVLANRGIKGSEAGNSLSSILINLTAGVGQAGDKLEELGVSAFNSDGSFKGITATLQELNEKTKNLTDEQRNSAFAMIGGKTQVDTLMALLDGLNNEYGDLRGQLVDCDDALITMAKTMNSSVKGTFELFTSAIDDIKLTIGEKLAPYIVMFLKYMTDNIPKAFYTCWETLAKVKNYIQPWYTALVSGAKTAFTMLMEVFDSLKPTIRRIIDTLKEMLPTFEQIRDLGLECLEALKPIIQWLIETAFPTAVELLGGIVDKVKEVYDWVADNWPTLVPIIMGIVGAIGAYKTIIGLQAIALGVYNTVQLLAAGGAGILSTAMGILNALFLASPIGWICLLIGALVAGFTALVIKCGGVKEAWKFMCDGIKYAWDSTVSLVESGINKVIGLMNKIPGVDIGTVDFSGAKTGVEKPTFKDVDANATGTQYFRGGLTTINEHGKEMINLPSGTQIVPHQQTQQLFKNANRSLTNSGTQGTTEKSVVQNFNISINGSGLTADDVIGELVPKLKLALSNM